MLRHGHGLLPADFTGTRSQSLCHTTINITLSVPTLLLLPSRARRPSVALLSTPSVLTLLLLLSPSSLTPLLLLSKKSLDATLQVTLHQALIPTLHTVHVRLTLQFTHVANTSWSGCHSAASQPLRCLSSGVIKSRGALKVVKEPY